MKIKSLFFSIFLLTFFTGFSQTKKLIGFGNAKIGMSILEFNKTFDKKINNANQWISEGSKSLYITNQIKIDAVEYTFYNRKLVQIKCGFNEQLYNGLVKIYRIDYEKKIAKNHQFFKFKNTEKNIICIGIKNTELVIYDKSLRPAKKTAISLIFNCESILELDKIENFEGL